MCLINFMHKLRLYSPLEMSDPLRLVNMKYSFFRKKLMILWTKWMFQLLKERPEKTQSDTSCVKNFNLCAYLYPDRFVVHSYYFKEVWKYLKLLIDTLTQSELFILPAAMIRRNPTRIELTLDDIEEYKNLRGNIYL